MNEGNPIIQSRSQSLNIQNLTAKKQEIKYQKGVCKGMKVQRLQLLDGDPTFNVAAERIGKKPKSILRSLIRRVTHVKINTGNESFELNIRSTAKRLGITQQEVKEISMKGDEAVTLLQEKAKIRQEVLKKYQGIIMKYVNERGELSQENGERTGLKPDTLFKAIQKGMTIGEQGVEFKEQRIKVGRSTFFATKDLSQLHFINKRLGSGTFGTVFKTVELTNAEIKALKVTSNAHSAITDLKNEHEVLTELNKGGPYDGIPPAPSKITTISDGSSNSAFCDMTLMSSDLAIDGPFISSFQSMKVKDRLQLCRQLLNGLDHMHENGYCHGDIKPENCLVKNREDGTPEKFYIGDHGGTRKGALPLVYTEGFRPKDYIETEESAMKSDVYAMAKTLIVLLGGTDNFTQSREPLDFNASDKSKSALANTRKRRIINHLKSCGIPELVAEVLIRGLESEKGRPSGSEFKAAFDKAILQNDEEL